MNRIVKYFALFTVLIFAVTAAVQARALKLTYEYSFTGEENKSDAGKMKQMKAKDPTDEKGILEVLLWPEAMYVRYPEKETVYDFANSSLYTKAGGEKNFIKTSIYSIADYRFAESQNRMYMAQMLGSAGVKLKDYAPEWLEVMFSVPVSENKIKINMSGDASARQYTFEDGQLIAKNTASKHSIPKDYSGILHKFLIYETTTNLDIKQDIIGSGRIPETMEFIYYNAPEKITCSYKLMSAAPADADIKKVLKGIKAALPDEGGLGDVLKAAALSAPVDLKKLKAKAERTFKKKMAEENYLDAFLAVMDYSLTAGDQMTYLVKQIAPKVNTDERLQTYVSHLSSKKKEQAEYNAKTLKEIDRSGLEYAYIMDIMIANNLTEAGDDEGARDRFFAALKKAPYIAGCWKDLGNLYISNYMQHLGWMCFDAAYMVCAESTMLKNIAQRKQGLREAVPEYF